MLLVADVGNTNIALGAYRGGELAASWRMSSGTNRTSDETGVFICSALSRHGFSTDDVTGCVVSSVVPDIINSFARAVRKYFAVEPLIVSHKLKTRVGFGAGVNAAEVGADRVVNCEAAYALYGGAAIVIDYGTATTYDAINADGLFLTGITAPGVKICADALFEKTSLLNKVELAIPPSLLITNTVESVQCGIMYGKIGETEYIVNRVKRERGAPDMKVIATGGLARVIAAGTEAFDAVNPWLTLEGLRIIYENNAL
jgi:type III pantothenate kinase